jgi:tyrosine-protein kinase Etk/Wzc
MYQSSGQARIDPGNTGTTKFDIRRLLAKAVSFLPWYILSLLIGIAAAKFYLEISTPVYTAKTTVLIGDPRASSDEQRILAGLDITKGDRNIENEKDVLKSYNLMYQVVDSLMLDSAI